MPDHPSNIHSHVDTTLLINDDKPNVTTTGVSATVPTEVRVRGMVIDPTTKRVLVQVNNRVVFGAMTITLPGGVVKGANELTTLAGALRDELGLSMELNPTNTRFVLSRTYDTPDEHGNAKRTRINFYAINSDGSVARNMCPDSVLSLTWMSIADIRRNIELDGSDWKVQLGAMAAIEAVLDPAKAKITDGGYREVSRQDGGTSPDRNDGYSRPDALPYA